MINPLNKTEYSFRHAYGKIKDIVQRSKDDAIVIADRFTTFGHIPFYKLCKKSNKRPILGVELGFVDDATLKVKQAVFYVTLIARNVDGLKKIYQLVSKSTKQKYYVNRLNKSELKEIEGQDVITIIRNQNMEKYLDFKSGCNFLAVLPTTPWIDIVNSKIPLIAASDNIYQVPEDAALYQIIMGNGQWESRSHPGHVLGEIEWRYEVRIDKDRQDEAVKNANDLTNLIDDFDLPKAELPHQTEKKSLFQLCLEGAVKRKCDLNNPVYKARLDRELELIHLKKYESYFYLVADLVTWAKQHMLVGPARGSSAGSLVCYLLFITDIDPIPFNLIFERFIDINRHDIPDIDIDFQDTKREMVLDYLKQKYDKDCVAKLGTVSKYKPKSILTELAKCLYIPVWEINDLKNAIPERSGGDARANNCIEDTFNDLEIGKETLKKYPNLIFAKDIESHNRHFGQHAAGIVVSDSPINNYCAIDYSSDGAMLDKKDAEVVNLLKMDCLGLRTLSVIQDCLDLIGKDREWLIGYPINDQKAFDILNHGKFGGIFQFEGSTLIRLSKKMHITNFEEISAITAAARPGPLDCGGADKMIFNHNNPDQISYLPMCKEYTKETYGVILYQEQVMFVIKNIGNFSWEDTSILRKAMSKSLGDEFFSNYKIQFINGALQNGIENKDAELIWNDVCNMGKYAFNKSHSISYGFISYYCMVLKAYYPLEFTLATLRNAKDEDQVMNLLRELSREQVPFKIFDPELSEVYWSIKDGILVGGFTNIKGIGPKKAQSLIKKRREGKELTASERRLIYNAVTPYDTLFEFKEKFGLFYENWNLFFKDQPVFISDIEEGQEVRFLAKTISVSIRDINEEILIKKRNGQVIKDGQLAFLDLKFVDDSDSVQGRINREIFEKYGRDISERDKVGSYYLVCGFCCNNFKYIIVKNIKKITPEEVEAKVKGAKT